MNLKWAESIIVPGAIIRYDGKILLEAHNCVITSNGCIVLIIIQSGAKKNRIDLK